MFKTQPVYRAADVRAIDAQAIAAAGDDGYALMCRAAAFSLRVLQQQWPRARRLSVLAGPGNNGGDALVLARLAAAQGFVVHTGLLLDSAQDYRAAAASAWRDFCAAGLKVEADLPPPADVIVDGMFGTGLSRPVQGRGQQWIEWVLAQRSAGAGVLALDIPSGLCADSGQSLGRHVLADHCCSFVGRKLGHYLGHAIDACGELHFDDLGVAAAHRQGQTPAAQLLQSWRRVPRERNTHKGGSGHVLAVGGSAPYAGALVLAAAGALRAGAGKVSLLSRSPNPHPAQWPEMMRVAAQNKNDVIAATEAVDVICLGPGLGRDDEHRAHLEILRRAPKAQVWDADALWALAQNPGLLPRDVILTPHPGEAAFLLGIKAGAVQADRLAAVNALVARFSCTVVLKGARTLVAAPDHDLCIVPQGNPDMAVGGMGDVLAGLIAGLRAQGYAAYDAAVAGAWWLASSADRCRPKRGLSLVPTDLLDSCSSQDAPI